MYHWVSAISQSVECSPAARFDSSGNLPSMPLVDESFESPAISAASFSSEEPIELEVSSSSELNKAAPSHRLLGVCLGVSSAFLFSLTQLCAHHASLHLSSAEIMLARCFIQTLVSGLLAICSGINSLGPTEVRFMCFLRGALGSLGNFLLLYAVGRMPVADASTIFFSNPIFTLVYAACLLNEPTTKYEVASLVMGLIGVTLVTRPTAIFHGQDESASPSTESTSAVAACIMGAAVSGLVPVIVRRIGDSVHQYCLVFYFGGTGTLLATAMLLTRFQSLLVPAAADSLEAYSLLAAICMLGLGTQFTFNRAMQIEKPQVCAVLRSLNVAFTFVWQQVGTKDSTEPLSTIGACLIVSSTLAILFAKGAKAQAESKTSEAEKGSVRVYGRE